MAVEVEKATSVDVSKDPKNRGVGMGPVPA